jgi:hypothetical protein
MLIFFDLLFKYMTKILWRGERSWELKFDLGPDPLTGRRLTRYYSFKGTKR